MNVAAVDIGTNSVRLLVLDEAGRERCREMNMTRLGQGVDETGYLQPAALERTLLILRRYAQLVRQHEASRLRIAATSAARDAGNREALFGPIRQWFAHPPELLSGDEEARWSFAGATQGLSSSDGPFLVFDIGGGSTELALGVTQPDAFLSLDMGCVRITERFLRSDPPGNDQLEQAREFIEHLLAEADRRLNTRTARCWIGLAGTVTTFAAHAAGVQQYDPGVTHGYRLHKKHVTGYLRRLSEKTVEGRRALLLQPERSEVILGGALILETLMNHYGLSEVRCSERDILDGLARSLLDSGAPAAGL